MPGDLTRLAFILHIAGGVIGLLSGILAMTARKGGRLHRIAGNTFFVSMMVMAVFAVYLGVVMPGALVNVFIGVFVAYLLATAWITIRRPNGVIGFPEKIGLVVSLGPVRALHAAQYPTGPQPAPFLPQCLIVQRPTIGCHLPVHPGPHHCRRERRVRDLLWRRFGGFADCAASLAHVRRLDPGHRLRSLERPSATFARDASAAGLDAVSPICLGRALVLLDCPRASHRLDSRPDPDAGPTSSSVPSGI